MSLSPDQVHFSKDVQFSSVGSQNPAVAMIAQMMIGGQSMAFSQASDIGMQAGVGSIQIDRGISSSR